MLIFKHPQYGKLHLKPANKRLPNLIRQHLDQLKEVRFQLSDGWVVLTNKTGRDLSRHPIFFAWEKVEVLFEPTNDLSSNSPFRLQLNGIDTGIQSGIDSSNGQLFGSLHLAQAVGYTDLEIRDANNSLFFSLQTEVFPQKLNYKEDFQYMIGEINDILYNLAFDFLKKTYSWVVPVEGVKTGLAEWLAMFSCLFESIDQSIRLILRHPHRKVVSTHAIKPISKIRKANHTSVKWLAKNPQYISRNPANGYAIYTHAFASHLPDQQKHISHDTFENQFLFWAIRQLIMQLKEVSSALQKRTKPESRIQQIHLQLNQWLATLQQHIREPIFKDIGTFQLRQQSSMVLSMAPGYRSFYHRFLLLQKGLRMSEEEVFRLDYKDISTLYEYWCFLKTLQILKEDPQYELESHDLIRLEHDRFRVRLKKGESSRINLTRISTGEQISIWYNRAFKEVDTHTFTQIPDHFIEFEKTGYHTPFRFILDAKYRFEMGKTGSVESIGPPVDAIGQLHRYRDAILSEKKQKETYTSALKSLGGVILFPYPGNEESFRTHRFFKSRNEVHIGAIPMHPGPNRQHILYRECLEELFSSSPEALHEQMIEYEKKDHHEMIAKTQSIVLIGFLPNDEAYEARRSFFLSNSIYYTLSTKTSVPISHIALYDSRLKQLIAYSTIQTIDIQSSQHLQKLGTTWPHRKQDESYTIYHLEKWNYCQLPFKRMGRRGKRYTTFWGLEQALFHQNEAYLWLPSYTWIRAWQQIRRMDSTLQIKPISKSKAKAPILDIEIHFSWKGKKSICRQEKNQLIVQSGKEKYEFNKNFF